MLVRVPARVPGASDEVTSEPRARAFGVHAHDALEGAVEDFPNRVDSVGSDEESDSQSAPQAVGVSEGRDVKGRWQPGVSGNPAGLRPGPSMFQELLRQLALEDDDGRPRMERLVERLLDLAEGTKRTGPDLRALAEVLKRTVPEAVVIQHLASADSSVVDSILAARDRVREQQVLDMQPTELFKQPVVLDQGSTPSSEETESAAQAEFKPQSDSEYLEELDPTDPEAAEAARRARWSRRYGNEADGDAPEPRRRGDDYDAGLAALERHRRPARSTTARGM